MLIRDCCMALLVTAMVFSSGAADAAAGGQQRSARLGAAVQCRTVAEDAARLRCYDAAVKALDEAEASGAIVVTDREQLRATRRALFGLSLPRLPIFARDDAKEEIDEIGGTVADARQDSQGRWRIRLEDGARWQQTDDTPIASRPRTGSRVVIKCGTLGSFIMKVDGQFGVKAKRVQ
jgi:hypothetical protein